MNNARHIGLTVHLEQNGTLSLWIKDRDVNILGAGSLRMNHDHVIFYREVARYIADCASAGEKVDYKDLVD